jgi:NAD(P)-dependent dehydrogenase (short-subunit alcohol dehydrogenase family)
MQIMSMMISEQPACTGRRYVVTGAASGIGLATRRLLEQAGHRVVGVDRHDVEVLADLATPAGRQAMLEGVRAAVGDAVDGVLACAGVRGQGSDPRQIVRVNYFGAVATLDGLRPLLTGGSAPRAAAVASIALLREPISEVVQACLDGEEASALDHLTSDSHVAYTSSKLALARWARRCAVSADWAGAGIALNIVAPGIINTPMADYLVGTDELRARTVQETPQPFGQVGAAEHIGSLLAWLTSAENGFVTGQVIFADGGYEAVTRGAVWP